MNHKTPIKTTETSYETNRSRFIAQISHAATEQDARKQIEEKKREHPKARHHCTAYITDEQNIRRTNDDGEPAGTAGTPILETLETQNLGNTLAIVTRYFGGTLLGAANLTRAYRTATTQTLQATPLATVEAALTLQITCNYQTAGPLEAALHQNRIHLTTPNYSDTVTLNCTLKPNQLQLVKTLAASHTAGQATLSTPQPCQLQTPIENP